ncbi:MAG: hypothetical protein IT198_05195 [Acidimicrobiia bacterium]|nr:hypothetical protein [Acidimicrobiia bacterium]
MSDEPQGTPDIWRRLEERILGPPHLTRLDLTDATGVDTDEARELWKALGFAPVDDANAMFTDTDLVALRRVQTFRALGIAQPDTTIQLARVLGQAASRVAQAQVHAVDNPIQQILASVGDDAAAGTVEWIADYVVPGFIEFVTYAWKRHLVDAVRRELLADEGTETVVGFADLVGFTALTLELEDDDVAAMIDRFEAVAYDHITAEGGRPVKIIGDEIMFVADDVPAGARIALDLVESFGPESGLPPIRAGLAAGPAIQIEGDLYGRMVNLASRLAVVARPGTILVAAAIADVIREDSEFYVRPLRPRHLKGIGETRIWVLRRPRRPAGTSERFPPTPL